jgi:hypothetical protein
MRYLTLLLALGVTVPIYAARQVNQLVAPPPGATLPVALGASLKAQDLTVGQIVTARLFQRVPLSNHSYLPGKAEIVGHVVSSEPSSVSLLFTQLRWEGQVIPVHVRLLAAASSFNVYQTKLPMSCDTDSSADSTTRQVGGDEIYLSAGSGKVYDQYSQPVGYANPNGVYQDPLLAGEPPRAMGPFSTTATGLHGLPGFSILSRGDAGDPITLGVSGKEWHIASGAALLLEVVS